MQNSSIRIDYITELIAEAINIYQVRGKDDAFETAMKELRKQFPHCNNGEVMDILTLSIAMYKYHVQQEHAEIVITAPDSFRVKSRKTHEVIMELLENAQKSIVLTGYSVSDYFSEHIDCIIKKSQQGVYVNIFINDLEKQKDSLERLMAYQSKFLKVYEYQKQEDKMAALHAKILVVDSNRSLISSANLSYHGLQGNIEMGILLESVDKAEKIEELLKELRRMKVFVST